MFSKKNLQTQKPIKKSDIQEYMLDDRLYGFMKNIKELAKDEDKAMLLARQLTNLIKADKGL
ncbi:molybdenum cofactor biosynthesis protein [Campylobacter sp. MIT 99-7217]|uniref:molybdenum cofactor biosynthesis protein n=1 Tax=Campylobacter sp. MIT 99-7217 TaxID=535091 RepID=UPI00115B9CFE|nr:molybdenum cofactor biosynthesis protein [Campylobacter sp. MIT 99-7217]TQR34725.1 molybdenum cofactor biosynthesis protein [Campylobacter sp. MIT 99-7217]